MKNFPLWLKFIFVHILLSFIPLLLLTFFLFIEYEAIVQDATTLARSGGLDTQSIERSLSLFHLNAGLLFGIFILILIAGTIISIRLFTGPAAKLLLWIRSARQKKFLETGDAPILSTDEIGELTSEINEAIKYFREIGEREKAISKAKSEFISVAAHQLRTPLTSIRWAFGLLIQKEPEKEEDTRLFKIGLASTERMIGLVNDLLNANSIEEGRFGLTFRKVDLDPLIDQAVEEIRPIAEVRKIKLQFIKESGPMQAFADPDRISIVLINLLSNAVNYTLSGGSVTVRTKHQGDAVEVSVEDTGVGMTPEVQGHLFSKFFRAPEAIRLHPDGSGLGLYIVKNIVERHGGKVRIKSKAGQGSIFSFDLRVKEGNLVREVPFEQFFSSF